MTLRASTAARIAILLLCAVLAFLNAIDLLEMEFGGGSLTGVLVRLCLGGSALFILCVGLALSNPRLVALPCAIAIAACAPLYIHLIAPRALRWFSSAPSSVQMPVLLFDIWAIAGLLSLLILGSAMVAGPGPWAPELSNKLGL